MAQDSPSKPPLIFDNLLSPTPFSDALRIRASNLLRSLQYHIHHKKGDETRHECLRRELSKEDDIHLLQPKFFHYPCPGLPNCSCGEEHWDYENRDAERTWKCPYCRTENELVTLHGRHPHAFIACQHCGRVNAKAASRAGVFRIFELGDRVPIPIENIADIASAVGWICTTCGLTWRAEFRNVNGAQNMWLKEVKCVCGAYPWHNSKFQWKLYGDGWQLRSLGRTARRNGSEKAVIRKDYAKI